MLQELVCNFIRDLGSVLIRLQFVTICGTGSPCRSHPGQGLCSTDSVMLWRLKVDSKLWPAAGVLTTHSQPGVPIGATFICQDVSVAQLLDLQAPMSSRISVWHY